jgi:hypothetical protein
MSVTLAPIRPVLRIGDICELLRISEPQFYKLKDQGWFAKHHLLEEVQPAVDSAPRYRGEPFVNWLARKSEAQVNRAVLREVEKSGVR